LRHAVLHLAWGPAELQFAEAVWRSELELRPALADAYRALRGTTQRGEALRQALAGTARYPRSPEVCGRLLRVLRELELVEYLPCADGGPACTLPADAPRTDLERSPSYRAYTARLHTLVGAPRRAVAATPA
jgi:hypothetical protein